MATLLSGPPLRTETSATSAQSVEGVPAVPFVAQAVGLEWLNPLQRYDYPTEWQLLWTLGLVKPNANDDMVRPAFRISPDYAPRIERHIRQLVPLKLATIGDGALEAAGNLVEAVAATTREFNELGAADMMAGMLAQAMRKAGMFERWFGGASGHVDDRAALGAPKQSLGFFPRRTEELAAKVRHAEENLVVVLAALSAVSDVVRAPDDAGVERTLFDRRNIVGQVVQQIRMQPAQLRGLDERVTDLLSRADHLMNVVLPAALAARPSR